MKKLHFITLVFIGILLFGVQGTASANILWQIGTTNTFNEFDDGSWIFYDQYTYVIGSDPDEINNPTLPGYLGFENLQDIDDNRAPMDTVAALHVDFFTDVTTYNAVFEFNRWGAEAAWILLDGEICGLAEGAGEGEYSTFTCNFGTVPPGAHTLSILYAGTGITENGFYIDSLLFEGALVPEPASMLLLGSGFFGFARIRKKRFSKTS